MLLYDSKKLPKSFPDNITAVTLGNNFSGVLRMKEFVNITVLIIENSNVIIPPSSLPVNLKYLYHKQIEYRGSSDIIQIDYDKNENKLTNDNWKKWWSNFVTDQQYYITTAINYTNGPPHLGHAYEIICADIIARYKRMCGFNVHFLTGSDEHGQKIFQCANNNNMTPLEYCTQYVNMFKNLNTLLLTSETRYIRTTDACHIDCVNKLTKIIYENGDIYFDEYCGYYNVKEEMFVNDTDAKLTNYCDPATGTPLITIKKNSYFFKLSKYQTQIINYIESHTKLIQPESSRIVTLQKLQEPLRDLSISRCDFNWGIPLYFDHEHVTYVWFDALFNYLSGANYNEDNFIWPPDVQCIGKDITWFHCVIWLAMLFSLKLDIPKTVFSHGFINDDSGYKMSKMKGNTIDPFYLLKNYSCDNIRLYLTSVSRFGSDISFSEKSLKDHHNTVFANTICNLVNRIGSLISKVNFTDVAINYDLININEIKTITSDHMVNFKLSDYIKFIISIYTQINHYLTTNEPWKCDPDSSTTISIYANTIESIYCATHFLSSFAPKLSCKIFTFLSKEPVSINALEFGKNFNDGITRIIGPNFPFYKYQ
jgi:methionyl-tRNA synthetase